MVKRMSFDFRLTSPRSLDRTAPRADSPLRILLIGDFSHRGESSLDDRAGLISSRPMPVDIDNFDRVMGRLAPRLQLPIADGASVELEFASLDDFHPDTLYRRLPMFQRLRETRQRLQNTATFAEAAAQFRAEAQRLIEVPDKTGAGGNTPAAPAAGEADADTLARLLGAPPTRPASPARTTGAHGNLDALIKSIVAPHIVPDAPPYQAQYIAAVDATITEQMRALIHHPRLQALESLWRGLQWLVSNLETNEQLQLYVLDATRAELREQVPDVETDIESCALYRLLVEQGKGTTGGEPWSLIVGTDAFGPASEDVGLLAYLGLVAAAAGGPFIAAAKPDLIGCGSIAATSDPRDWRPPTGEPAAAWTALRGSEIAPWIGLAFPRILLRLPYGKAGEPVESLAFEEHGAVPAHEHFLWGSGALACALLIGRAFCVSGWDMALHDELEVADLPAYVFEREGEKLLQACAEANLGERAADAMLDAGLMPLLSYKNRNAVRLARWQSIARPAAALQGPWAA